MPTASIQLNRFILAERPAAVPAGQTWLSRAWIVIRNTQMRRAEAEVARLIELRGGRFNDALEREIERRSF